MIKINLKSKKIKWAIAVIIVLGLAGAGFVLLQAEEVEVSEVSVGPVEEIVKEIGTLMSQSMVDLTAYGSAEVISIEVEVGQKVTAGTVLASQDDSMLQYQLESLANEVKAVEANMAYLSSDTSELAVTSASNSARIARENFEKAQKDYENAQLLFNAGAISRSELDSFELMYNVNRMSYTIALNSADTTSGSQDTTLSQVGYQLKSLQAQLERVRAEVERYTLRAPFDSVVSAIYVDERDYAHPGQALVQVYEQAYYIEVNLLEDDLVLIEEKTPVRIDLETEQLESAIIRIHPIMRKTVSDLGVSQLKGTVDIESTDSLQLVGRELDVLFVVDSRDEAVLVDQDAVFRFNGQHHVYKVAKGKAVLTPVELGISGEDQYEVLDGLAAGDTVILNPPDAIADGTNVKY